MAFRKKAEHILKLQPDILVVPECEHPDKIKFPIGTLTPTDVFWFGKNANKGLGVFSFNDFRFKLYEIHNEEFRTILPLSVNSGLHNSFNLFAIWANNPMDTDGSYITQIWKAIHFYENILKNGRTILLGDFNSNTIWDKPYREGNHSTVVERLKEKDIHSTYHKFYNQLQGKESHPTLFMYRHKDKPYHIDYCFASADIIEKVSNVQVGTYEDWILYSDHTPLIVTVDL